MAWRWRALRDSLPSRPRCPRRSRRYRASPGARSPSSSRAKAAPARSSLPAPSTLFRSGPAPSKRSTAPPFPPPSSRASCSARAKELSPGPAKIVPASCARPTGGRCCSTRWRIWRLRRRQRCSGSCRNRRCFPSVRRGRSAWTCASSPRRRPICDPWSLPEGSGPISSRGSMPSPSGYRRCASDAKTSASSWRRSCASSRPGDAKSCASRRKQRWPSSATGGP